MPRARSGDPNRGRQSQPKSFLECGREKYFVADQEHTGCHNPRVAADEEERSMKERAGRPWDCVPRGRRWRQLDVFLKLGVLFETHRIVRGAPAWC